MADLYELDELGLLEVARPADGSSAATSVRRRRPIKPWTKGRFGARRHARRRQGNCQPPPAGLDGPAPPPRRNRPRRARERGSGPSTGVPVHDLHRWRSRLLIAAAVPRPTDTGSMPQSPFATPAAPSNWLPAERRVRGTGASSLQTAWRAAGALPGTCATTTPGAHRPSTAGLGQLPPDAETFAIGGRPPIGLPWDPCITLPAGWTTPRREMGQARRFFLRTVEERPDLPLPAPCAPPRFSSSSSVAHWSDGPNGTSVRPTRCTGLLDDQRRLGIGSNSIEAWIRFLSGDNGPGSAIRLNHARPRRAWTSSGDRQRCRLGRSACWPSSSSSSVTSPKRRRSPRWSSARADQRAGDEWAGRHDADVGWPTCDCGPGDSG